MLVYISPISMTLWKMIIFDLIFDILSLFWNRTTQETIEALGGMDIMPKHSHICRCRYVCIFKLSFR